jgi:hypothetical protein
VEIEFEGYLDKKTFLNAILLAAKGNRKRDIVYLCFGLVFLGGFISYFINQNVGSSELVDFTLLKLIIPLVFIAYFLFIPFFSPFLLANKSWKNPSMQKLFSGTVTNQGIEYSGISDTIEWNRVMEKQNSDDLLILLSSDKDIVILPKKFFKSETEWKKVILLSNYKVSKIN